MIYGNIAIHGAMEKAVLKHTKHKKHFFLSDKVTTKFKFVFLSLMKNLIVL